MSSGDGSSQSYIDRILIRKRDKDITKFPQISPVSYSDHKFASCMLYLDKLHSRGSGNKKRNTSILATGEFRNWIKLLIGRTLTGFVINNKCWYTPHSKRDIKFKSIIYSIGLVVSEQKKGKHLVKDLEETMRTDNASQVKLKRLKLKLEPRNQAYRCIVKTRLHAVGYERFKTVGWARVLGTQHENDFIIQSLVDQQVS